jgi:DCN1-like protein 1/2
MKKKAIDLRSRMEEDRVYFTEVYRFTFVFNLPEGQRLLSLETAAAYWTLLIQPKFAPFDKWIQFINEEYKKSISKDTWNMFWEFVKYYNDNNGKLDNYDLGGAWPSVIDEFVEYLK